MKCENLILAVQVRYKLRYARSSPVQWPSSTASVELGDKNPLISSMQLLIQLTPLEVQNNLVKQSRKGSLLFLLPALGQRTSGVAEGTAQRVPQERAASRVPSQQRPSPAHCTPAAPRGHRGCTHASVTAEQGSFSSRGVFFSTFLL